MFSSILFIFKQSFKLSKKSLYLLAACLCLKFLATFFGNLLPIIASKMLKSISLNMSFDYFLPILIFYWPLKKLKPLVSKVGLILISSVISELFKNISKKYLDKVLQMPLQKVEEIGASKLSGFFNQCQNSVSVIFYDSLFLIPLEVFDGIITMFLTAQFCGAKYFFIVVVANAAKAWTLVFRKKNYQQKKDQLNLQNSKATGFIDHAVKNLDFVQSGRQQETFANKFDNILKQREHCETAFHQELEITSLLQILLALSILVIASLCAYYDIICGKILPADLIIIFSYISKSLYPATNILNLVKNIQNANRFFEPILKIIQSPAGKSEKKTFSQDVVKLEDVCFSYNCEQPVLENMNLEFKEGINCVVGKNGSGKTTLLKVIAGLYNPAKGLVHIPEKWSKSCTYLTEQTNLYKNVSVGECRQKQLKKIFELEKGLYILDEPTENLDKSATNIMLEKIQKLAKNNIFIIATHDQKIIEKSDKIISL